MTDELEAELKAASAENAELHRKLSEPVSDDAIEEAARLRLGLIKPDDIIFIYR